MPLPALIALVLFLVASACEVRAGEFTVMGGASFFRPPETGTYWNNNQSYVNNFTPLAYALRYDMAQKDSYSLGVQYTNFGEVTMDDMAVSVDGPATGGYLPATGGCVGPCASLYRFRMKSSAQSVAMLAVKHWGNWSLEGGVNIYEVKTSGIATAGPTLIYRFPDTTFVYAMPVLGAAYRQGPWSVRVQIWWMPSPNDTPGAFTEDAQPTLLIGYSL
jgi:hypothetical protein